MANNLNKMRTALLTGLLVCAADINAQIVKGTITDKSGEPIIGATVQEVGLPGNGTVTDLDGNFSIDMKGGKKTLKISYVLLSATALLSPSRWKTTPTTSTTWWSSAMAR